MWLDEADSFAELFKGYLPYYLLVALPIMIIIAPASPVMASHEFSVYRMQQYDLHTVPHGCRSASINLEGRSLKTWATSRHCVVARIQDITIEQLLEIRKKAASLLLVLPRNVTSLSADEKENIGLLEMAMAQHEFTAPVYFAQWSPAFEDILQDLQHSFITDDKSGTALEAMVNSVSSNGYQVVVSASTPQKLESIPVSLHAKLVGSSSAGQTMVIAANFDSFSVAPDLSFGADSNASGTIAVLELARIFSQLYSNVATRGASSILFLLTGAGPALNYFAAKKWLEDQLDTSDATLLQDVSFVMCLESISSSTNLVMHVSKPPKPGSSAHSINSRLGVPFLHKKINLAEELLAWQHERFSIRRMTAFTLSALQSHKEPARSTVLDTPSEHNLHHLVENIRETARALASHIYNITDEINDEDRQLYDEALNVDEASVRHWYKFLTTQSRSPQAVTSPNGASSGITQALERAVSRYIGDVTVTQHVIDKREPELSIYSPTSATLHLYSVKPAVFDLILTIAILAYLGIFYIALQAFPRFYDQYTALVTGKAKVQ